MYYVKYLQCNSLVSLPSLLYFLKIFMQEPTCTSGRYIHNQTRKLCGSKLKKWNNAHHIPWIIFTIRLVSKTRTFFVVLLTTYHPSDIEKNQQTFLKRQNRYTLSALISLRILIKFLIPEPKCLFDRVSSKLRFTYSKLKTKTLQKDVIYVQS